MPQKKKKKKKKNAFSMSTAKDGFHIPYLHPKKHVYKKNTIFIANLLEKFQKIN